VVQQNGREMAAVEARYLPLAKAFDHREHGCVDEAESKIGVGAEQFADPDVVTGLQLLDDEGPALDVLQEAGKRSERNEVIEFDEYGSRNEPDTGEGSQQLSARGVVLIVRIQQRDERPCVNYERNGGGS